MAFEIELDEKGELAGQVPPEIDAYLKRFEAAAHGRGYSKGMSEAAEAAKKQIEDNVRAEVAKIQANLPIERDKWARVEEDNKRLQKELIDQRGEHDRTLKGREESHARELLARSEQVKARDERIRRLTAETLRGLAVQHGVADDALEDVQAILKGSIGYDDNMEPLVVENDGQPRLYRGHQMTLAEFVKEWVDAHPRFRKAPNRFGGGALGGAAYSRSVPREGAVSVEAATRRINEGDRSPSAINDLYEATRKKAATP